MDHETTLKYATVCSLVMGLTGVGLIASKNPTLALGGIGFVAAGMIVTGAALTGYLLTKVQETIQKQRTTKPLAVEQDPATHWANTPAP